MAEAYFSHQFHRDGDFSVIRLDETDVGLAIPTIVGSAIFHPLVSQAVEAPDGIIIPDSYEVMEYGGAITGPSTEAYPMVEQTSIVDLLKQMKEVAHKKYPHGVQLRIEYASDSNEGETEALHWFGETIADLDAEFDNSSPGDVTYGIYL